MSLKSQRIVLLLSLVLFFSSCFLPALEFSISKNATIDHNFTYANQTFAGWYALIFGWLAVNKTFGWFANFFYMIAVICALANVDRRVLCGPAIAALVLAASTITLYGQDLYPSGSPPTMTLYRLREGFYIWCLSIAALYSCLVVAWLSNRTKKPS